MIKIRKKFHRNLQLESLAISAKIKRILYKTDQEPQLGLLHLQGPLDLKNSPIILFRETTMGGDKKEQPEFHLIPCGQSRPQP
jgi:hypothetical protein